MGRKRPAFWRCLSYHSGVIERSSPSLLIILVAIFFSRGVPVGLRRGRGPAGGFFKSVCCIEEYSPIFVLMFFRGAWFPDLGGGRKEKKSQGRIESDTRLH